MKTEPSLMIELNSEYTQYLLRLCLMCLSSELEEQSDEQNSREILPNKL